MTSSRLIASMSIKTKVTLGFGLVLAILLAVAATSYLQFLGAADSFRTYAQRVSVVSVSRDIDRDFIEMRRNVREFALTGVAEDATAALASADLVRAAIAKGLATSHVAERRRRLEEISTQYEDYRKGVERVFVLKRDLDKLTSETLDPSAEGGD